MEWENSFCFLGINFSIIVRYKRNCYILFNKETFTTKRLVKTANYFRFDIGHYYDQYFIEGI